jgi:hypothetical protein
MNLIHFFLYIFRETKKRFEQNFTYNIVFFSNLISFGILFLYWIYFETYLIMLWIFVVWFYFQICLMLLNFYWCFILFWDFFLLNSDINIFTRIQKIEIKLTNNNLQEAILFDIKLLMQYYILLDLRVVNLLSYYALLKIHCSNLFFW